MSAFADCDKAIAGYSAHSTFGRSGQIRSQTLVQVRGVPLRTFAPKHPFGSIGRSKPCSARRQLIFAKMFSEFPVFGPVAPCFHGSHKDDECRGPDKENKAAKE
jgi:hypothetical protein